LEVNIFNKTHSVLFPFIFQQHINLLIKFDVILTVHRR